MRNWDVLGSQCSIQMQLYLASSRLAASIKANTHENQSQKSPGPQRLFFSNRHPFWIPPATQGDTLGNDCPINMWMRGAISRKGKDRQTSQQMCSTKRGQTPALILGVGRQGEEATWKREKKEKGEKKYHLLNICNLRATVLVAICHLVSLAIH